MKFDTVIFDVDGTLIDNSQGIYNCIRYALQKMGLPDLSDSELRAFVGPPLFESGKKILLLDDENAERFVTLYRERFSVKGFAETTLYDGVREMLCALQAKGVKMAIATGKPLQFIEKILPLFDLNPYFTAVHGITFTDHESDKLTFIRRSLADCDSLAENTVMVGDRHNDMEAAKAAGVFAAGVTYGFGTKEELLQAGADRLFASPAEFADYILN